MDRKRKRPAGNRSRKRKKLTPAEIRTNLLIVAVIFVVSVSLFVARSAIKPVSTPTATTVAVVPSVKPVSPEHDSRNPAPAPEVSPAVAPESSPVVPEATVVAPLPEVPRDAHAGDPTGKVSPSAPLPQVSVPTAATNQHLSASAPVAAPKPSQPLPKLEPRKSPETRALPKNSSGATSVGVVPPSLKKAPPVKNPAPSVIPASRPERPVPKKHKGTIIFVFDDAGHNLKQLAPFLALPFPCTIAVLPGLQYSREAAQRARAAGKEVILHQPMQAINLSTDPGPDAITKGMTADQIRATVRKNLAEVGSVSGLNNHEGSLITADRTAMNAVFDVIHEKGIYFLDSRTNAKTVAPSLARERNMTIWERAVFLDNSQDRSDIIEMVYTGMKIAENKGTAIMIGHIWSNDLANILTSMYPELVSEGFSLSTIARIAIDGDMDE
jgi:polysaccharide deacetylase 2 family uncharacterized protein YibQ